jgi:N-acetylmuramic acid 6-phosphate etherase
MLTTGAMARLGYIYGNLMVNVHTKNEKLVERGLRILEQAAGIDRQQAARALKDSHNQVAVALIMVKSGLDPRKAGQKLKRYKGNVRRAVEER